MARHEMLQLSENHVYLLPDIIPWDSL